METYYEDDVMNSKDSTVKDVEETGEPINSIFEMIGREVESIKMQLPNADPTTITDFLATRKSRLQAISDRYKKTKATADSALKEAG